MKRGGLKGKHLGKTMPTKKCAITVSSGLTWEMLLHVISGAKKGEGGSLRGSDKLTTYLRKESIVRSLRSAR